MPTHIKIKDSGDIDRDLLCDTSGRLITEGSIGGVVPQLDDTDKLAVSLYGNDAAAGDKPVNVSAAGDLEVDLVKISGVASGNLAGQTALALEAASTSSRTSSDVTNVIHRTLRATLVTANKVGTIATYKLSLEHKFDGTNYVAIWTASSTVTDNGTTTYSFGPGVADIGATAEAVETSIPAIFRLKLIVAFADGSNNMDTSVFYDLGV